MWIPELPRILVQYMLFILNIHAHFFIVTNFSDGADNISANNVYKIVVGFYFLSVQTNRNCM
jgi:hypothetical protein